MLASDRESLELDTAWPCGPCDTVQEYLQATFGRLDETGRRHAFRGVSRRYGHLRSSFDRRNTGPKALEIETGLLLRFLDKAWDCLMPQERHRCLLSEKRWNDRRNTATLVVARHRLVPTRCVDWTDCRLRALFFACADHPKDNGEVWWFDKVEFDHCVGAQWPSLFGKEGHVTAEIEQEFIAGAAGKWFTGLKYILLPDDRPDLQEAWITLAGQLGTCHAEKIHSLGVRRKGRLVIPSRLKSDAMQLLEQLGITKESLGLRDEDPADSVAAEIKREFEDKYPLKTGDTPRLQANTPTNRSAADARSPRAVT